MQRIAHRVILVGALVAFGVAFSPVGAAAESRMAQAGATTVLDQSFTGPIALGADINECCRYIAQTFTAGQTGLLAGVNVDVQASWSSTHLHVAIRTVTNGHPSTTVLGETTLPAPGDVPLTQLITFPQQIAVTAGVQYAIVLSYDGAPPPGPYQSQGGWMGAPGDDYPGGTMFASYSDGVSWMQSGSNGGSTADLHFRTYVTLATTIQLTGPTKSLPGGGVVIFDSSGAGHLLTGDAWLVAQLPPYAGRQMTVVGTIVGDPATEPHYPIRISDFRLEPGGAFNGQQVAVGGPIRRLADGSIVVDDSFGHGHRLRAAGALQAQLVALVGHTATIHGTAVVNAMPSRLNWPIVVTGISQP